MGFARNLPNVKHWKIKLWSKKSSYNDMKKTAIELYKQPETKTTKKNT